jgi:hypothetical protein
MSAAAKPDFAAAAARIAASSGPRARERRRFRRMPMVVAGRMLDPAGREYDCRTADLSPGDVRLVSATLPGIDDQVVLYLEGFGRLAGRVARRCGEGEVAIIFDISTHKREKMAETLTWKVNGERLGLVKLQDVDPTPAAPAAAPINATRLETEFGETIDGEVLDFSLSGITLRTTSTMPPLGSWVRIGGLYGRVARRTEGGFAVDFEPRAIARYRNLNPIQSD